LGTFTSYARDHDEIDGEKCDIDLEGMGISQQRTKEKKAKPGELVQLYKMSVRPRQAPTPSNSIVLSMQINLIPPTISPHTPLQPRHTMRNIDPHPRRSTNEHTRPPTSPLATHLFDHERDIWPAVLGAPARLFGLDGRGQEGEAHQVFLEFGRCGREAEVKVFAVVVGAGVLVLLLECGGVCGLCGGYVEGETSCSSLFVECWVGC